VAPSSSPQTGQPIGTPVTTGNIYSDVDEGKSAIRSQKKPGIVLLVTPQDLETQRVEKILQTPQFQTILKDMILIRVDVTKDPKIMSRYGIHKTPSLMLYDSKGMMRKKISSMTDVNSMMREFQSLK